MKRFVSAILSIALLAPSAFAQDAVEATDAPVAPAPEAAAPAPSEAAAPDAQLMFDGQPVVLSDKLKAIDPQRRLTFIQDRLRQQAKYARIWTFSWVGINAALTGYQLYMIPNVPVVERPDYVVGASATGLALVSLFAFPLTVRWSQPELDEMVANAKDPLTLLPEAERMLFEHADNELFGVSPFMHIANLALNAAAAVIIGWGYGRWWPSAAYIFGVGVVLAEATILTQPTGLIDAARQYMAGDLPEEKPAPVAWGFTLAPLFDARGNAGAQGVVALSF